MKEWSCFLIFGGLERGYGSEKGLRRIKRLHAMRETCYHMLPEYYFDYIKNTTIFWQNSVNFVNISEGFVILL